MASFSNHDATKQAIKSAIEIQEAIQTANIKRQKEQNVCCSVGIGIAKGKVIVGNVGFDEHMDHTAIGMSVNMTARLCSHAKAGEILIDKKSYDEAGYRCKTKLTQPLSLKGISHELLAYSIIYKEY
jgi:adenylate cyclase